MTVEKLIEKLEEYNPKAKIQTVVKNCPQPFEICFGSSEGVTEKNCEDVSLMIDCRNEKILL